MTSFEYSSGGNTRVLHGDAGAAYSQGVADGTAAERSRLRPVLEDALSGLEDMLPYVPEYFREKHDHQGYLDRARAAVARLQEEGRQS